MKKYVSIVAIAGALMLTPGVADAATPHPAPTCTPTFAQVVAFFHYLMYVHPGQVVTHGAC